MQCNFDLSFLVAIFPLTLRLIFSRNKSADPITYQYYYNAPSNTGIPSGFDLNNDGSVGGPDDAFGFGFFPGQYGFVVLSKYPIAMDDARTFQEVRLILYLMILTP
jgi:hypothetical protein